MNTQTATPATAPLSIGDSGHAFGLNLTVTETTDFGGYATDTKGKEWTLAYAYGATGGFILSGMGSYSRCKGIVNVENGTIHAVRGPRR